MCQKLYETFPLRFVLECRKNDLIACIENWLTIVSNNKGRSILPRCPCILQACDSLLHPGQPLDGLPQHTCTFISSFSKTQTTQIWEWPYFTWTPDLVTTLCLIAITLTFIRSFSTRQTTPGASLLTTTTSRCAGTPRSPRCPFWNVRYCTNVNDHNKRKKYLRVHN